MVIQHWWFSALLLIIFPISLYFLFHKKRVVNRETEEEVESNDQLQITSDDAAEEYEFQVFLSFRGADTRTNFTDHLYRHLRDLRIRTFRDSEKLHVGEKIGPKLMEAIEQSKIFIPILSKGYASSKWCLMELTHMVKCVEDSKESTMICPIFYDVTPSEDYDVTPSEVRNQTGSFEEAFDGRMNKFDKETVDEWKEALKTVSDLKGWERDRIANGHESELVNMVGMKVSMELKTNYANVTEHLVGTDHHEEELMQLLDLDCDDVKIVGIVGMGGIGKTTIAKVVYNKLCHRFNQRCSILENVRENAEHSGSLDTLKNKLMSDILKMTSHGMQMNQSAFKYTKALIVLDDVKDRSQLMGMIGKCGWFGSGSRIIVTTKNRETFREEEGESVYEPREMNSENALRLFCKHAFRRDCPLQGYETVSKEVVSKVAGLPLSLEVIGSLLSTKKRQVWDETLEKLEQIVPKEVQERLQISYDMLDDGQKEIFLDIACHFLYSDEDTRRAASYMWEDCGFFPVSGIEVLVTLSLVKVGYFGFTMHDQLRDLGREIARKQNPRNPGYHSRLWSYEVARDALISKRGTERVETLTLDYNPADRTSFHLLFLTRPVLDRLSNEEFRGLSRLRYLKLSTAIYLEGDLKGLLSELRWFSWNSSLSQITVTNFCLPKLVVLDLSMSSISDGWDDLIQIKMARNLKVLDLSYCVNLTKTPELSAFPKLERFNLRNCSNLVEISASIGHLKCLTFLNLDKCGKCSEELLGTTSESLTTGLEPSLVSKGKLPEFIWSLKSLVELRMGSLPLVELPEAIGDLTNLAILNIGGTRVKKLPNAIGKLKKLEKLDASWCKSLDELPETTGDLRNLRQLHISFSNVERLPSAIGKLEKLDCLEASCCKSLGELPENIGNLRNLILLRLESTAIKKLPAGIVMLQNLRELDCSWSKLGELPSGLWSLSSLINLRLSHTRISSLLPADISCCSHLTTLDLGNCPDLRLPSSELKLPPCLLALKIPLTKASLDIVVRLPELLSLAFHQCDCTEDDLVEFPIDLGGLFKLNSLEFHGCRNFTSLPVKINNLRWPRFLNMGGGGLADDNKSRRLVLHGCESLERLPDGGGGLADDNKSGRLVLHGCESLERLQDLTNALKELRINNCPKLFDIDSLSLLTSLVALEIENCPSLESLPDFSALQCLEHLAIRECVKLRKIRGLEALTSLGHLRLTDCPSLEKLPDLSHLKWKWYGFYVHNCGPENKVIWLKYLSNVSSRQSSLPGQTSLSKLLEI